MCLSSVHPDITHTMKSSKISPPYLHTVNHLTAEVVRPGNRATLLLFPCDYDLCEGVAPECGSGSIVYEPACVPSWFLVGRPLNTYQPSKSPRLPYKPCAVFTHTEDYGKRPGGFYPTHEIFPVVPV